MRPLTILNNTTCYGTHSKYNVDCNRKQCEHWINHSKANNCTLIAASKGEHTLQEVGEIFGVTRMRCCQIEHEILKKLKEEQDNLI